MTAADRFAQFKNSSAKENPSEADALAAEGFVFGCLPALRCADF